MGRLVDYLLKGLFLLEGSGSWFWNLSGNSLVLGHGSREGSRRGWCWGIWGQVWIWEIFGEALGGLCGPFLTGLSLLERAGVWVWNLGKDSPVLGHGSRGGSH